MTKGAVTIDVKIECSSVFLKMTKHSEAPTDHDSRSIGRGGSTDISGNCLPNKRSCNSYDISTGFGIDTPTNSLI